MGPGPCGPGPVGPIGPLGFSLSSPYVGIFSGMRVPEIWPSVCSILAICGKLTLVTRASFCKADVGGSPRSVWVAWILSRYKMT